MKLSLKRRRKFTISATALCMTFVLALTGTVNGANWVSAVGLIVGLYGGAEALEGGLSRQNGGDSGGS